MRLDSLVNKLHKCAVFISPSGVQSRTDASHTCTLNDGKRCTAEPYDAHIAARLKASIIPPIARITPVIVIALTLGK